MKRENAIPILIGGIAPFIIVGTIGYIILRNPSRGVLPSNTPPPPVDKTKETEHTYKTARGIFSLTPVREKVPSEVLRNDIVQGVSLRDSWVVVEQSDDEFDWSYLDRELQRVGQSGKKVFFRILSGGRNTPSWLLSLPGVESFSFIDKNPGHKQTYGKKVTIPLFWDSHLLDEKSELIRTAGARYSQNKNIAIVGVSCANAGTDDWFVPHEREHLKIWIDLGYETKKLVDACKRIIDVTMEAFPNKLVALAVAANGALDPYPRKNPKEFDPHYAAREVVNYARAKYGKRFIVQKNSLSAITPNPQETSDLGAWEIIYENRPFVAGQMLWYVTNDATCRMNKAEAASCDAEGNLRRAIETAKEYDMRYIEVYQVDILNPDLQDILRLFIE